MAAARTSSSGAAHPAAGEHGEKHSAPRGSAPLRNFFRGEFPRQHGKIVRHTGDRAATRIGDFPDFRVRNRPRISGFRRNKKIQKVILETL
jgi:hypothetical protein